MKNGFTLIELSIVLVIIGLIIGGVLVGQDLIHAAEIRAQVTQIEKYNTAVNTFRGKYGDQLPGDIAAAQASQFGFTPRGLLGYNGNTGDGDGNGLIEGYNGCGFSSGGETRLFWNDLGVAGLIDGNFVNNTDTANGQATLATTPQAKIGGGNSIYVWSGGFGEAISDPDGGYGGSSNLSLCSGIGISHSDGNNYFAISPTNKPGLTVNQAYAIDKKIDDGLPQSGNVTAMYLNGYIAANVAWATGQHAGPTPGYVSAPSVASGLAATGGPLTCYDDAGSLTNTMQYSVEISGGNNINCALSFKFQ